MKSGEEHIDVQPDQAGERLDLFLAARQPDVSRTFLQRLIHNGHVLLNNAQATQRTRISANDHICINWPKSKPMILRPEAGDLQILYRDDAMLVINKPAGLVVHPGAGTRDGTLVNLLLGHDYPRFSAMVDDQQRPGIVHRLDKETSGVLIVACNIHSLAKLSALFSERKVKKSYLALVRGRPDLPADALCTRLGRSPRDRKKMAVLHGDRGKEAITRFQLLDSTDQASLILAQPFTGRTHQIRVHLAWLKAPVLGDKQYAERQTTAAADRHLLHAWRICLPHPETNEIMTFEAPLPDDFIQAMRDHGLNPEPLPATTESERTPQ